jgi:hypothetical protein
VANSMWFNKTENIETKNTSSVPSYLTLIVLPFAFYGSGVFDHNFFHPFTFHTTSIAQKVSTISNFSVFTPLSQSMTAYLPFFVVIATMLVIAIFIISVSFNVIFYSGVMPGILFPVSRLCMYHKIKSGGNINGETIEQKIFKMILNNIVLTVPIVLSLIYILNPSSISPSKTLSGFDICLTVALAITPGFLLILRLMAKPTHEGKSLRKDWIIIKRKFSGDESDVKKVKENISSFLGTLIFLTILYYFLDFCANYLSSGSYSTFFKQYPSTMPPYLLSIWIVCYIGVLCITTTCGELILEECKPILQEDFPVIQK